jgi:membrane fusion protein, multidrug efflux system
MIKRFIIAFVLVAIVCGGIVGFNMFRDQAIQQFFANMPQPALTVSTQKVEPVKWSPGIEAIGTVAASRGVDLTVETTGIVREVGFTANQKIEQGTMLLRLDDAVQRADLEAGRTQAALNRQTLERATALQRRGVGAETAVETAQAAASAADSQVAKLEAVLDQRQLIAPFDGTIGLPRIEVGQYLAPGTVVATLQDLETLRVDFTVPEQQLPFVSIGQPVRMGLSAGDLAFRGTITGIEPKIDPVTRLVAIRAEVENHEGRLSPGQFVQLRVTLPEEDGVLAIVQTALTSSLYGDFVYVVRPAEPAEGTAAPVEPAQGEAAAQSEPAATPPADATTDAAEGPRLVARQVFVKTGRRNLGMVEITEGLAAGDEVVTAGQNRLSNNAPVAIDNTVNPAGGQPGNQTANR